MKYAEIHIDLEPYLIKFVCTDVGTNNMRVNPQSELGIYVLKLLSFPPNTGWKTPRVRESRRLTLRISRHTLAEQRTGQYLSDDARLAIARCITSLFWEKVNTEVMLRAIKYGQKEGQVLRKIKAMYDISEEDFKEESMGRRYRRWKQRFRIPMDTGVE